MTVRECERGNLQPTNSFPKYTHQARLAQNKEWHVNTNSSPLRQWTNHFSLYLVLLNIFISSLPGRRTEWNSTLGTLVRLLSLKAVPYTLCERCTAWTPCLIHPSDITSRWVLCRYTRCLPRRGLCSSNNFQTVWYWALGDPSILVIPARTFP